MHFGFSTFFFFGVAISDALDRLLSGGVRVIEFMHEVPHSNEIDSALIAKMKRLLDEGIQFSVHAPFLETNLGSYFEEVRRFSKERVKAAIEFASTIQADPVVVHPGYSLMKEKLQVLNEQARENFLKDLGEVVSFADGLGVRLALENGQMPFFFLYNVHEFPFYGDRVPHLGQPLTLVTRSSPSTKHEKSTRKGPFSKTSASSVSSVFSTFTCIAIEVEGTTTPFCPVLLIWSGY